MKLNPIVRSIIAASVLVLDCACNLEPGAIAGKSPSDDYYNNYYSSPIYSNYPGTTCLIADQLRDKPPLSQPLSCAGTSPAILTVSIKPEGQLQISLDPASAQHVVVTSLKYYLPEYFAEGAAPKTVLDFDCAPEAGQPSLIDCKPRTPLSVSSPGDAATPVGKEFLFYALDIQYASPAGDVCAYENHDTSPQRNSCASYYDSRSRIVTQTLVDTWTFSNIWVDAR